MVDLLAGLADEQWEQPTLCEGWTVRTMAGHLRPPAATCGSRRTTASCASSSSHSGTTGMSTAPSTPSPAGSPGCRATRSSTTCARHAGDELDPPKVGLMGPFADTCLHLGDVARPLGLPVDVPTEHWVALLDYLVSPEVAPALAPRDRADGLRLVASDAAWRAGSGPEVSGPVEALATAVTGRPAALCDLTGDGVTHLADRIRR